MSSLGDRLKQAAIEVLNSFQQRRFDLEKDLQAAQQRVLEIQTALDQTKLSIDRFNSFQPDIGGNLQCPRCWISRGAHVAMAPQESGTDLDEFRCRECQFEFEV